MKRVGSKEKSPFAFCTSPAWKTLDGLLAGYDGTRIVAGTRRVVRLGAIAPDQSAPGTVDSTVNKIVPVVNDHFSEKRGRGADKALRKRVYSKLTGFNTVDERKWILKRAPGKGQSLSQHAHIL